MEGFQLLLERILTYLHLMQSDDRMRHGILFRATKLRHEEERFWANPGQNAMLCRKVPQSWWNLKDFHC